MNIEKVNKKKEDLLQVKKQQEELQNKFLNALEETKTNLNRIEGGIIECNHWIKELTDEESGDSKQLLPIVEENMEVVD